MAEVRCFWVEPTDTVRVWLRRYRGRADGHCSQPSGYHDAQTMLGDFPASYSRNDAGRRCLEPPPVDVPHADPRWPTHCTCGMPFDEADNWQHFQDQLYRRADTGEVFPSREAAPGAMYYAWWFEGIPEWCGPDGRSLCVVLPDGRSWLIDGRASNCTLPDDHVHKCWLRHGEPPNITVDKAGGFTCSAGGGSIATPTYHGFLTNGVLIG